MATSCYCMGTVCYVFCVWVFTYIWKSGGFPGGTVVKNADAGDIRDVGLIPGLERFPGVGNGNLYSCLENSMDRGACRL